MNDISYGTYRQSAAFILNFALHEIFPQYRLLIRQAIDRAPYCCIDGMSEIGYEMIEVLDKKMRELIDEDIPFEILEVDLKTAQSIFKRQNNGDIAEKLGHYPKDKIRLFGFKGYYSILYGEIVKSTGEINEFELVPYQKGLLLKCPNFEENVAGSESHTSVEMFEAMQEQRKWMEFMEIPDVLSLNKAIKEGKTAEIVILCETVQEKMISNIATEIADEFPMIKLVLISGPSSSGKTTFAQRLRMHLLSNAIRPVTISLDNYYVEKSRVPLDENGQPDFESLEAIDYELFNEHVNMLFTGKEAVLPKFDFSIGRRADGGKRLKLGENQILIVEGIHGLNEKLSYKIPKEHKYKIYCSALTSMVLDDYNPISPTDTRLLRRLVRDVKFRNAPASMTFSMWDSVRRGERINVFPFVTEADKIFNSFLLYEFSAYKNDALKLLKTISVDSPYYKEAQRLCSILDCFVEMSDEYIPATSIIREFIGGSAPASEF